MAGATCDTLEGDNNAFTVALRKFFGKKKLPLSGLRSYRKAL